MITALPQWFTSGVQVLEMIITPVLSSWLVAALDVKLPLKSDTALVRSFDLSAHPAGKYIVKLHWEADQLKYDSEQEINLP
jgi:hypothetical protein